MNQSDLTREPARTQVPFAFNDNAPLNVDTERDGSIRIRDTNGAPILDLWLDFRVGEFVVAVHRDVRLSDPRDRSAS